MAEPRRHIELSGVLGRSRVASRVRDAQLNRSLLRCRVGPYPLVIDLRDLTAAEAEEPDEPAITVDLREAFGTPSDEKGRSLAIRGLAGERVELVVDAGVELCAVDLTELYPFPSVLHAVPALRCLCGVVKLAGELHFLLDPMVLVDTYLEEGPGRRG